jgi:hypothetical protein
MLQRKGKRGGRAAGSKQQVQVTVEKACESLWKVRPTCASFCYDDLPPHA